MKARIEVLAIAMLVTVGSADFAHANGYPTAGSNLGLPPSGPFWAPYSPDLNGTMYNGGFYFDPGAGPIEKHFETPWHSELIGETLFFFREHLQPGNGFPILENWYIADGQPVEDWHEIILTPGWEWWYYSGPPSTLITVNGQPWPHTPSPDTPPGSTQLSVDFPPIQPGNTLEIHKWLFWWGTFDNQVWGDALEERYVDVIEYPTPEPASIALLALGGLTLLRRRN